MIVKTLSVSLLTLVLASCSITIKTPCDSIDLASILRADKIEVTYLRTHKNNKIVIDHAEQVKDISYRILTVDEDWSQAFGTDSIGNFLLNFYEGNRIILRMSLDQRIFSNGGCFKPFSQQKRSSDLYLLVSDLFNKSKPTIKE